MEVRRRLFARNLLSAGLIAAGVSMAGAAPAQDAAAPTSSVAVPLDRALTPSDLGAEATLRDAEAVNSLIAAMARVGRGGSPSEGVILSLDGEGHIHAAPAADDFAGKLVLTPYLLDRLRHNGAIDPATLGATSLIERRLGSSSTESVAPGYLGDENSLPGGPNDAVRLQARQNGWVEGLPKSQWSACQRAQSAFTGEAERTLGIGNMYYGLSPEARQARIDAINAYDHECLTPVTPGQADLPLDRLAILFNDRGDPVCMALHLGGDRFLTANHCVEDNGRTRADMSHAVLTMADRSDARLQAVEIMPNGPFAPGLTRSVAGRDLALLRAPGLSDAVKARGRATFANGNSVPTTVAQPALAIGLFLLADPVNRIPADPMKMGSPPPWSQALRMTRDTGTSYCRVWSRSKLQGGGGCLEHSCQTLNGFSGTPVFVRQNDAWVVAGINTADAAAKSQTECGAFIYNGSGFTGLLGKVGAVATIPPDEIVLAAR
ncbi:trypsin-like peptidase domain-containing protein [Novosphingobium sp. B-7]|uniref:trypsin-like peptidase domain-containing protein n=1 Tax=Novosphingobium sp. B-7 TaxID=1298855 RepID=UPI00130DE0ED|nr:trypsin-like peptidase domain-containing protein [Novosphingobium sp. B-7]